MTTLADFRPSFLSGGSLEPLSEGRLAKRLVDAPARPELTTERVRVQAEKVYNVPIGQVPEIQEAGGTDEIVGDNTWTQRVVDVIGHIGGVAAVFETINPIDSSSFDSVLGILTLSQKGTKFDTTGHKVAAEVVDEEVDLSALILVGDSTWIQVVGQQINHINAATSTSNFDHIDTGTGQVSFDPATGKLTIKTKTRGIDAVGHFAGAAVAGPTLQPQILPNGPTEGDLMVFGADTWELLTGVDGDILYHDGATWKLLNKPSSDAILTNNNSGALAWLVGTTGDILYKDINSVWVVLNKPGADGTYTLEMLVGGGTFTLSWKLVSVC